MSDCRMHPRTSKKTPKVSLGHKTQTLRCHEPCWPAFPTVMHAVLACSTARTGCRLSKSPGWTGSSTTCKPDCLWRTAGYMAQSACTLRTATSPAQRNKSISSSSRNHIISRTHAQQIGRIDKCLEDMQQWLGADLTACSMVHVPTTQLHPLLSHI